MTCSVCGSDTWEVFRVTTAAGRDLLCRLCTGWVLRILPALKRERPEHPIRVRGAIP